MEKEVVSPKWRSSRRGVGIIRAIVVVSSVLLLHSMIKLLWLPKKHSPNKAQKQLEWMDIEPSPSLYFHDCFDSFRCSRLEVPLDWTSPVKDKRRAAIALTMLPAKVPVTDSRYGGSILINPGGPSGSGVLMVLESGKLLQTIVDSPYPISDISKTGLFFDIIGFDPRGVNYSTPSVHCFPDDITAQLWSVENKASGFPFTNESFGSSWGRSTALARSCSSRLASNIDDVMEIGRYMGTPSVAEDMLAIIEALGEWREEEAKKAINNGHCHTKDVSEILDRTAWVKGKEKLKYWGFSYGTILGMTFSTLHPDRVGRVVVDGVMEADDYYNGTWMTNLHDTDSIIESFFTQCFSAGPEKCAFYSEEGVEVMREKYIDLFERLKDDPISVHETGKYGPSLITLTDSIDLLRGALYSPRTGFPNLAEILHDILEGNATKFMERKHRLFESNSCLSPACRGAEWSPACYDHQRDAFGMGVSQAILCGDGRDSRQLTKMDYWGRWHTLTNISTTLGAQWATITVPCANWEIRPAWQFESKIEAANTSHPMLFLSNTRDPVTPLGSARKMVKRFGGAVLFGQDADGHCTIAQPSTCVIKGVREYFQTGRLPKGEIACKPDVGPFDDLPVVTNSEDRVISEAIHELTTKLKMRSDLPLGVSF